MVVYSCTTCKKSFKKKCHLEAHLNRKRPCHETAESTELATLRSEVNRMQGHMNHMQSMFEQLQVELNSLKSSTTVTSSNTTGHHNTSNNSHNTTTSSNNTTTTNHTHNTFYLSNFGSDDTSFLTAGDLKDIASFRYNKLLLRYIEKVNCNKSAPQNHNFLISNLRSDSVQVFTGGKWVTMQKKEALERFLEFKEQELTNLHACEKMASLPEGMRLNVQYAAEDDDDESLGERPKQVERLLYTHAKTIKETKKKTLN